MFVSDGEQAYLTVSFQVHYDSSLHAQASYKSLMLSTRWRFTSARPARGFMKFIKLVYTRICKRKFFAMNLLGVALCIVFSGLKIFGVSREQRW